MSKTFVRVIRRDENEGIIVSTIWVWLDLSLGSCEGLHWETMVLGGTMDQYSERYSSEEEAIEGHKRIKEQAYVASNMDMQG